MWSMTNLPGRRLICASYLRQLAPVELDVGVPAEGMHLRHELVHDVEAEHAAVQRHDAHRADAGLGQALELGFGRAGLHHGDAFARRCPSALIASSVTRVVVAVGVGLHHHHALRPRRCCSSRYIGTVNVPGHSARPARRRARRRRNACACRVAPAGALSFISSFPSVAFSARRGFGTSSAVQKMPPWCASAIALSLRLFLRQHLLAHGLRIVLRPVAQARGVGVVVPAALVARDAVDDLELDAGMVDADRDQLRDVARAEPDRQAPLVERARVRRCRCAS